MEERVKFLAMIGAGALLGSAATVAVLKLLPRFLTMHNSSYLTTFSQLPKALISTVLCVFFFGVQKSEKRVHKESSQNEWRYFCSSSLYYCDRH